MTQSSVILASLLGGFVVYLAITGKLHTYWTLLAGGGTSTSATGASSGAAVNPTANGALTGSPGGFDPSTILNAAEAALLVF